MQKERAIHFSQELVDFLNHGGISRRHKWIESNPSLLDFVNSPHVIIRPVLFHEAQQVAVKESPLGRFVMVLKRNGERCYIFQIENESLTVEQVEAFIANLEQKGGYCHIEASFLVIDLPFGYLLDLSETNLMNIISGHSDPAQY